MDDAPELRSKFLLRLEADLGLPQIAGARRIVPVVDGRVSGPRIKGRLLPAGGDWMLERPDGSFALDVRATIETEDGAIIYVQYLGRLVVDSEILRSPRDARANTDTSEYYFRTMPLFETDAPDYAWLANVVAVGVGRFTATGVAYDVHEIC